MTAYAWSGWADTFHAEVAVVELERDGVQARGTQLGVDPVP